MRASLDRYNIQKTQVPDLVSGAGSGYFFSEEPRILDEVPGYVVVRGIVRGRRYSGYYKKSGCA